jgi:transcriptional regulator of acetoin/glycerol metabolism
MAVANIEHRYFDDGIPDCELLRLHHDPALLGTAREALLAFRNGKLIAANRIGMQLFGLERSELGRAAYGALFADALGRLREHGLLFDRQGRAFHGRIDEPDGAGRRRSQPRPIRLSAAAAAGEAVLFDAVQEAELERARRVLDAGVPVLVRGETGTGKEVFARELHRRCGRAGKPFVAVNCAALPEGLIEAELFGYEDGAFTGARRSGNPGLLRQADGGILFLDEIGDMPLTLQPRLLRVLQERELSPLGGGKSVKLDFALVCATHCDLEAAVREGRFRADLYYRIAHHGVTLTPLREQADRTALVLALWQCLGQDRYLGEDALAALVRYDWPGNLRQLAACLRTMAALSEPGALVDSGLLPTYVHDVGSASRPRSASPLPGLDLDTLAETAMREAVRECGGNMSAAARRLGISRSTLYRRLRSAE